MLSFHNANDLPRLILSRVSVSGFLTIVKCRSGTVAMLQPHLQEYYLLDVTARSAANLLRIQANSAILFYRKVRQEIAGKSTIEAQEIFNGDIEIDESYLGGVRKGKRGRGAAGKVVVFGMLKRHGKVYTVIVEKYLRSYSNACYSQ